MPQAVVNGIRIGYERRGSGPPLLLIHGFTRSRLGWLEGVLGPLSKRFALVLMDNRGTGESDKPPQGYSIEAMADDGAGLLQALSIPRAHVFGVSMGGMIAQRLALRHPALVHGLVLGCTYFGGREAVQAQPRILDLLRLMPNESMPLRQVAYLQEEALYCQAFRESQRPLLDCFFDLRMQNPTPLHAVLGQAKAVAAFDASQEVAGIRAPTLLITGDSDVLIPPENSRLLAQRIPGARLVTIPQAAHEFWIEQPQATAQAVIPFLEGLG